MPDSVVGAFASRVDCSAGSQMCIHRVDLDGMAARASLMPADGREAARAAGFRFERDRARYLAARRALRSLLADYLAVDSGDLRIDAGPNGKPMLVDPATACEFNVSHSNGVALIAMHRGSPIGVDIEAIVRPLIDDGLARQCLSADEYDEWRLLPAVKSLHGFYGAWTRKEAVLKALGIGLSVEPSSVNVGFGTAPTGVDVRGAAVKVWTVDTGVAGEMAAVACRL